MVQRIGWVLAQFMWQGALVGVVFAVGLTAALNPDRPAGGGPGEKRSTQESDRAGSAGGHTDREAPSADKPASALAIEKAWPTTIPPHPPATAEDIQRFLAALKAQMPDNWVATPPRTGKVRPTHWAEGQGTVIRLARKGCRPEDWKRGKGGEVLVWMMAEAYAAKKPSAGGAQVAPARELPRWCQRRVLVWGSGGDDWRGWEGNVGMALKASWRAGVLLQKIDTFELRVQFLLVPKTPERMMVLSVVPGPAGERPHTLHAVISKAEARKIITYLTTETFLAWALDSRDMMAMSIVVSANPRCIVSVRTSEYACSQNLGWGPPMLGRVDALRKVLEGDAAKVMDKLLKRLEACRQQWQRTAETIKKLAGKSDLIVLGTVAKIYDGRARDGGMSYDVKVGKVLKGKLAGKTLHFRSAGHVAYAEYKKGETVLLFLYHWGDRRRELLQHQPVIYLAERARPAMADGALFWEVEHCLKVLTGAAGRARTLRADLKKLRLELHCYGPEREPARREHFGLTLAGDGIAARGMDPNGKVATGKGISSEIAKKIIDHLDTEGFLSGAASATAGDFKLPKIMACVLVVSGPNGLRLREVIVGWGPRQLRRLRCLRQQLDGDAAKAMDKLLERWEARGREWIQANNEPNRQVVELVPTHVWCHSSLFLRACDRQHGIEAVVPVPRKLHKALEVPVSGKLKQGAAIVSYYRGKRIDNLLAPGGTPIPPSGVGRTEYVKHEALSGSVTVTPLPGDSDRQKVEVTFKDLSFKGLDIKKIGPLKAQLGLPPPP